MGRCDRGIWTCQVNQFDVQGGSDGENALVTIEFAVNDATNPGVGNLFEAVPAGTGGNVDRAAVNHDAVARGLQDGVTLRVDGGDAVTVLHHVPGFGAMRHATDGPVVAGRQDGLVAHDHGTHRLARTG